MAKMIKKTNGSKKSYRMAQLMVAASLLGFAVWCGIGAFVIGVLNIVSVPFIVIFAVFLLAWVCAGLYFKKRCGILKAGVDGEKIAGKVLSKLSNDYTVIKNAVVTYEESASEIDLIVVSERGVVIVEAKNLKGVINGDVSDKNWEKTKIRGENQYTKKFYNPVKQLSTQIHRLAGYLRENGIDVYVEGAVCFTDDEVELNIVGNKKGIQIFALSEGKDRLLDYITDRKKTLSDSDVEKIKGLLGAIEQKD